jgi:CheY-like chemotaxis protein
MGSSQWSDERKHQVSNCIVLVVEPDPGWRTLFELLLADLPGLSVVATDGENEAWRLLLGGLQPDLVVFDPPVLPPRGLRFVRGLKADARFRAVPVIAVHAWDSDVSVQAVGAGCCHAIQDRFDINDFEAVVRKWLPTDNVGVEGALPPMAVKPAPGLLRCASAPAAVTAISPAVADFAEAASAASS